MKYSALTQLVGCEVADEERNVGAPRRQLMHATRLLAKMTAPLMGALLLVGGRQPAAARADEAAAAPADLILVVEMNAKGEVLVKGREPLTKPDEVTKYLAEEFRRLKRLAEEKANRTEPECVVRAHKEATFERVYGVMKQAKEVGFAKVSLRAVRDNK